MEKSESGKSLKNTWLSWLGAVAGWLVCAGLCLWFILEIEPYPYAYEMFFPFALLLLFGNIFLFLFISARWGEQPGRLFASLGRVCVGEGLFLAALYCLSRFFIGT